MIIRSLGRVDYQQTWEKMRAFTDARTPETEDELWVCEHSAVFTQGVAGKPEHLLFNPTNIPVIKTDRGGQITYHGPGQAMMYVLLNLKRAGYGVREMVMRIENAVIALLAAHGIQAYGKRDAPGVYVRFDPLSRSGGEGWGEGGDQQKHLRINPAAQRPEDLKHYAREMRASATDAEALMWSLVRDRRLLGLKFRRQHTVGCYILDFYCDELQLAVELDGGQHQEQVSYDNERTGWFEKQGIRVLRFWNSDVMMQTDGVMTDLFNKIQSLQRPAPQPLRTLAPVGAGVLREKGPNQEAKIAALGLKVRNGHTYHGLAFNVNMDLTPFSFINPCGYDGLRVTHLQELGVDLSLEAAGMSLAEELRRQLTAPAK